MSLAFVMLANAAVLLLLTTLLWIISVRLRDVSIVDLFWGTGFGVVGWVSYWNAQLGTTRGLVLAVIATVWGVRLSVYLGLRNHGRPEDYRYAAMRAKREKSFWWSSLFIVFWLQGAVMWLVSLPLQAGSVSASELSGLNLLGIPIWVLGFFFEAVGDYQLARFKRTETGVMNQGLWRYTRHPNYFGNALLWWGITLVALESSNLWILVSPMVMTFLLVKVSGVALLERSLSRRSTEYQQYMQQTSSFFPMPPRKLLHSGE